MKTHLTITPEDLDAALAVPWGCDTCLLAQCAAREGVEFSGASRVFDLDDQGFPINDRYVPKDAAALRMAFDNAYGASFEGTEDERQTQLAQIRAKLPLTIKLEELV